MRSWWRRTRGGCSGVPTDSYAPLSHGIQRGQHSRNQCLLEFHQLRQRRSSRAHPCVHRATNHGDDMRATGVLLTALLGTTAPPPCEQYTSWAPVCLRYASWCGSDDLVRELCPATCALPCSSSRPSSSVARSAALPYDAAPRRKTLGFFFWLRTSIDYPSQV